MFRAKTENRWKSGSSFETPSFVYIVSAKDPVFLSARFDCTIETAGNVSSKDYRKRDDLSCIFHICVQIHVYTCKNNRQLCSCTGRCLHTNVGNKNTR